MLEDLARVAQPEYLTDALRRAGALGAGRVCDVVVGSSKATILSRIIRLRLSYDGPAADAPASLILKTRSPVSQLSGRRRRARLLSRWPPSAAQTGRRLADGLDAVQHQRRRGRRFHRTRRRRRRDRRRDADLSRSRADRT